jgi:hypothetical protein
MKRLAMSLALSLMAAVPAEAMADIHFRGKSAMTAWSSASPSGGSAGAGTGDTSNRARTVGNRVSERRWRGIFRIRVRVLRGDRLVDVCSARTRWRVLRRD